MCPEIKVTDKPLFKGEISPFIYGEFVEFLNDLIPGMWAERIRDGSFEGQTNPRMFYRKEKDFPKPAWREFKAANARFGHFTRHDVADVAFTLDERQPFVGTRSAKISVSGTRNYLAGIAQSIGVKKDEALDLEVFLRGENAAKAHVFIGREYGAYVDFYDRAVIDGIGPEWGRFTARLTSPARDANAIFVIALAKPGTLWIDKVSLMPSDNMDGWRRDVVEEVRSSKPGIIRFGGSSLIYYDWKKGIGPREERVPFLNTPWNNTEENDVGLDEFLRFCELVEAEPLICANSNSSTPEDIARQVEYVNGPEDSEWGGLRAKNGHPKPYNVKYWQIGNEQRGDEYEKSLPKFIKAMKGADQSISLLAAYPSENIVRNLSKDLDYVCPHFYEPEVDEHQRYTEKMRERIDASRTNTNLKLGITEWSHTAGDWGDPRAWLQTLYNGLFVGSMLNHYQRNGDIIRIANRSNLVNSCYSGSIQTNALDMYVTPAHLVQKLYATMSGSIAVSVSCSAPGLDVSASMDADSKRVVVFAANPEAESLTSAIDVSEFGEVSSARSVVITGPSDSAVNSFERKHNVWPVEEQLEASNRIAREFPSFSVTVLEFSLR